MWTRLGFSLLTIVTGGMLWWQCTPQVVQLDPNWPSSSAATEGGTFTEPQATPPSDATEGDTFTESQTIPPLDCAPAPAMFLKQTSDLSSKRSILLWGQQPNLKHKMLRALPPKHWRMIPDTCTADDQGQFAFWLHRQETPIIGNEKVTLWLENSWCYWYSPVITDRENQKKAQSPSPQTCKAGQDATLSLELQGKLSESTVAFSTRPDIITISSLRYEDKTGPALIHVRYRCHRTGDSFLLIGGGDLDAQAIAISVQP